MKIDHKKNKYESKDASKINEHIRTIASLKANEDLCFSFYLDMENPIACEEVLKSWAMRVEKTISLDQREHLRMAVIEAIHKLRNHKQEGIKTTVLFMRYGALPVKYQLGFAAKTEVFLSCDTVPNLSQLIEFRDSYDRYLVLIASQYESRILEINLGEVTSELWLKHPEDRIAIEREVSKLKYQKHKNNLRRKFISETAESLKNVVKSGAFKNIILAGSPKIIGDLRTLLPKNLEKFIIDETNININQDGQSVVAKTLHTFVQKEMLESQEALDELLDQVHKEETAILGLSKCEAAVNYNMVDVLLVTKPEYQNGALRVAPNARPSIIKRRDELLRLAATKDCKIEFVEHDSYLNDFDGVGALLKHRSSVSELEWLGHFQMLKAG